METKAPPAEQQKQCLQTLIDARKGDEKARIAMQPLMKQLPNLVTEFGDVAKRAVDTIIRHHFETDHVTGETVRAKMAAMKAELAGPNPNPMESLLAERIVICWLQLYTSDLLFYVQKDTSAAYAERMDRNRERASKRYLAAIKALATVHKLALPVLQMNIGRQQVNVTANIDSQPERRPPLSSISKEFSETK